MTIQMHSAEAINRLADALNRHQFIKRFDVPGEPQAGVLAHALLDLDESFRAISLDLLPKLLEHAEDETVARNVLQDIGEALRHIIYHIRDMKFFSYLDDTTPA